MRKENYRLAIVLNMDANVHHRVFGNHLGGVVAEAGKLSGQVGLGYKAN